MANGLEIITMKQRIFSNIVCQDAIIQLIDDAYVGEGDSLINKNFFRYFRIPETEEETKSYICCEINVPNLNARNEFYREVIINIWVITHQDLMDLPDGTRIDLLGWEIEKLFNGSTHLGGIGKATLVSSIEDSLDERHRFRRLQFSINEPNQSLCDVP